VNIKRDVRTNSCKLLQCKRLSEKFSDIDSSFVKTENVEKIATRSTEPIRAVGINVIKKLCDPIQMKYSNLLHLGTTG